MPASATAHRFPHGLYPRPAKGLHPATRRLPWTRVVGYERGPEHSMENADAWLKPGEQWAWLGSATRRAWLRLAAHERAARPRRSTSPRRTGLHGRLALAGG